jgi:hypothetical protein
MVFNAAFNYILAISWRSVLLVEVPRVTDLLHNVYRVHLMMNGIQTHGLSGDRH